MRFPLSWTIRMKMVFRCAMLIFSVKMTIHEEMPIGWGILEICKEE